MTSLAAAVPGDLLRGDARFEPSGGPATLADWKARLAARAPTEVVQEADGSFAIGLTLSDGRVVLAVDRFAQETLCYRVVGDRLHFAHRADDLSEGAELDEQALFDYLYFHAIPSPRTAFRGVCRLPPGYVAVFDKGRLDVQPYWRASFAPLERPDFDALRGEFRQLLRQAVQRQLGHGTPACFLSGGTDSSTVAGLIAEVAGEPPATYSIGFEAQGYDEMAYARIAAKRFRTRHHEHYVTPDELVQDIPHAAAWFDQPFGNSSALPAFACARLARSHGVQRLLAGDGGDELFGGNSRYAVQQIFDVYRHVPAWVRHGLLEPVFGREWVSRTPLLRKGSGYIRQARTPMPDRLQSHNLLMRLGVDQVLTPAFLARVDRGGPLALQQQVWGQAQTPDLLDRTLAYDWRFTLADSDLPKVRGAIQMAGMEVGFPLLDRGLLDFSTRLPISYKLRGMKLRWFFKEALRDLLPPEIIHKKKHGFGLPFGVWAVKHPALRRLATDSLQSAARRGLVRQPFVDDLLSTLLPAHPGYYGEMVWILMMLEQWLARHRADWRID